MSRWVTFAGVIVTVNAPADTPEHEIADRSRELFMKRLGDDTPIRPHDVGVGEIHLLDE